MTKRISKSVKALNNDRTEIKSRRKRFSKAICKKQTLKKYINRPSPPYRAALCVGKHKRGNDGNMYVSKPGINYGPAKWIKAN